MTERLKNIFRTNLPVKAASLITAIILWLIVMAEQNPVIDGSFEAPIILDDAPRGYKITTDQSTAQITVQGLRSHLITAENNMFQIHASLKDMQEGAYAAELTAQIPQNFELVGIKPERINVTLDPYIDRQIPVELIVTGQTAVGTTVAAIGKNIEMVTVAGPKSKVETVTRVVGYVGLTTENNEDFSLNVPITAINADGREVKEARVLPSAVVVNVQLARGLTRKVVDIADTAKFDNVPEGYAAKILRINPTKIEIAGESSVISPIKQISTEKISLKDVTSNVTKMVRLDLPSGVTVTDATVSVDIEVTKIQVPDARDDNADDNDDKTE